MTVQVDSIYADPSEIDDKKAAAHTLAAIVHADPEDQRTTETEILARLNAGRNFAWIARRVSTDVSARVHALNMKGIYYQKEFQRFYPDNQIAAQVLGYVGVDDNGLGGLEDKFDAAAARRSRRDVHRHGRAPQNSRLQRARPRARPQSRAHHRREHPVPRRDARSTTPWQKTQALNGTVVVQDVHTGQILALAIRPTFNPNNFRHTTPDLLRDHAVSDVYEPGSIFKLVTYSTALDQHVATPDDPIDCQGGKITLAGRVIHDNQGEHYGVVPVHQALEVSSDVAAIKLALKVGPDRFYQYIRDFGFGSRTGVELPGETRGLLRPVKRWGASSIGSIAIGQEIAVTPVQLVTMVSTIANGGVYLPPHSSFPGQIDPTSANQKPAHRRRRRSIQTRWRPAQSPPHRRTSRHRHHDRGANAQDDGRRGAVRLRQGSAAQRLLLRRQNRHRAKNRSRTHTYSKTMHIASFTGFAPVNNPVIAIAVVMDSPKGEYYGAEVSAPVFAEVAQQVLEYLGVPARHRPAPSRCLQSRQTHHRRRRPAKRRGHQGPLRRRQRSAQRRPAERRAAQARKHSRQPASQNQPQQTQCPPSHSCPPPHTPQPAKDRHPWRREASARPLAPRPARAQSHRAGRRRRP